jgi:PAS domain S-box-containing protein
MHDSVLSLFGNLALRPAESFHAGETDASVRAGRPDVSFRQILEALPAAVYATDAEGTIIFYNEAAVALSGHRPVIGRDKWCVSWKLFWPDGRPLPHDECPMAIALKENRAVRGHEAVAERPDGTRVPFIPFPTPIRDEAGKLAGAINMLVDVSSRKEAEARQRVLLNELNHRVKNNMQLLHALLRSAERGTRSEEARAALRGASQRVAAMSAAQKVLYDTCDAARFDARRFLESVCGAAGLMLEDRATITVAESSRQLSNDTAMPLALILNELLTNAAKHGAVDGKSVAIAAGLERRGDHFVLTVEDDGPGFDFSPGTAPSSGLGLVKGLAGQLGGALTIERSKGARCSVHFPEHL